MKPYKIDITIPPPHIRSAPPFTQGRLKRPCPQSAFSLFFSDIPHFVRRDIFAFAKVILRLWHSDIIFAFSTAAGNITRLKVEYHCVAIELAVRRI